RARSSSGRSAGTLTYRASMRNARACGRVNTTWHRRDWFSGSLVRLHFMGAQFDLRMSLVAMTSDPYSAWWVVPSPKVEPRLRLLCFPFAGASATAYHRLALKLPADVETCSLQLPGRGFRMREAALETFEAILDAMARTVAPRVDRPYALFGHSMG